MLKVSKGVLTCCGLKQQIGGETQEQTQLLRNMLALSCVEWIWAGDKAGRKEKKCGGCPQSNIRACFKALAMKADVEIEECPLLSS